MQVKRSLDTNQASSVVKSMIIVPEMCKRIMISKKTDASIENFFRNKIDVSFFDQFGKWYGRFDRGRDEMIIEDAGNGFLTSGKWNIFFEIFQIFEPIEITLDISFECYDTYKTYTGELHTHTNLTDGQLCFDDMSGYLEKKGYDFFFMADHNSTAAWKEFHSLKNIKGYRAEELTTFYGHALLLGISDYVSWYDEDGTLKDIEEIRNEVRLKGGIMGIAHPFTSGGFFYPGCRWEKQIKTECLDFLEIWNSKVESSNRNWEAINYWLDLLKKDIRISGTCGADFHRYSDLDKALRMKVLAVKNNESSIVDAIRKGRFYITGNTKISFDINDKTFGQTVEIKKAEKENKVQINYTLENRHTETDVFIVSKGTMKKLEKRSDSFNIPITNERDFFLLMGIREGKKLDFITNPVFVDNTESGNPENCE